MPQEFINGKVTYDKHGQYFWVGRTYGMQMLAQLRGWGTIQHLFKTESEAAEFQDSLGQFIAEAINEKVEREKSKPK